MAGERSACPGDPKGISATALGPGDDRAPDEPDDGAGDAVAEEREIVAYLGAISVPPGAVAQLHVSAGG